MDVILWNKILAFDFDDPMSEYGFSTRLAHENSWTINFTETALLEYKKFLFLAATTDAMVSPSEIVDIVWHQHLIFTKSYSELAEILGKKIDHIPSTHNHEDFEKFKLAKERTNKIYTEIFGNQPSEIWNFSSIHEPLFLEKSSFKIRTFLVAAIIMVVLAMIPVAKLLNPFYLEIGNPQFILSYIALAILLFIALEFHNQDRFAKILQKADKNAFVFNLTPFELLYLKNGNTDNIIHANVNNLIKEKKLQITKDNKLKMVPSSVAENLMEFAILKNFVSHGSLPYPILFKIVRSKPVFTNISRSMNEFFKYVVKSRFFVRLYIFNFTLLALLFLLGLGRLITGISRHKPVGILMCILFVLCIITIYHLFRMTVLIGRKTIHSYYKSNIIPKKENKHLWYWGAYLIGNTLLNTSFVAMLPEQTNSGSFGDFGGSSSSCGSSGESSCGSSCGSCGGCGGD